MKDATKNKVLISQTLEGSQWNMAHPTKLTVEAELYKDGDEWCCLIGENIQDGCAGFGRTPQDAIHVCAENAGLLE